MSPPAQHAGLRLERWQQFSFDQQLLMIANEMSRASKALALSDLASLGASYERALRLIDLTVAGPMRRTMRRELLRFRDLIAQLYLTPGDADAHWQALSCLLLFSAATESGFGLPTLPLSTAGEQKRPLLCSSSR